MKVNASSRPRLASTSTHALVLARSLAPVESHIPAQQLALSYAIPIVSRLSTPSFLPTPRPQITLLQTPTPSDFLLPRTETYSRGTSSWTLDSATGIITGVIDRAPAVFWPGHCLMQNPATRYLDAAAKLAAIFLMVEHMTAAETRRVGTTWAARSDSVLAASTILTDSFVRCMTLTHRRSYTSWESTRSLQSQPANVNIRRYLNLSFSNVWSPLGLISIALDAPRKDLIDEIGSVLGYEPFELWTPNEKGNDCMSEENIRSAIDSLEECDDRMAWLKEHATRLSATDFTVSDILPGIQNDHRPVHVIVPPGCESAHTGRLDIAARGIMQHKVGFPNYASEAPQSNTAATFNDGHYPSSDSQRSTESSRLAPPIALYCPAFAEFAARSSDAGLEVPLDLNTPRRNSCTRRLQSTAATLRGSAISSRCVFSSSGVDGMGIKIVPVTGESTRRGARVDCKGEYQVPLGGDKLTTTPMVIMHDNELGTEDGDITVRGASTAQQAIVAADRRVRDACCCPTFVICLSGPWLTILGLVLTSKWVVQRLGPAIYLGNNSSFARADQPRVSRVFYSLRLSLQALRDYFDDVF
ncbi:hypothetical protein EVG20_g8327 [Dentipellis fragilis]|uniref:Uncharacterized protein n=1 Tax=Dentipellis fragilis TaxID=205917 RepID=A0A4Y9Y674_9AGAM|nr:hypothetical protein EVG20_g8327 [Dentipellis fragilis]